MIDCLECRRRILATPRDNDAAVATHVADCAACATYRGEVIRLDLQLERVVRVPVPECLPARIIMRQASQPKLPASWAWSIALAASLIIAILIGREVSEDADSAHWTRQVVTYVQNTELGHEASIAPGEVDHVLQAIGVTLDPAVGPVSAVEPCVIDRRNGAHLVIDLEDGPVTLLILPDNDTPHDITFTTTNGSGIIAPCPRGSIAVLAATREQADTARQRIERSITFI